MDPNLTTPIILNATLNATLIQPPQSILSNPAITTLLGIVIGWLLNLSSSAIQEKRQLAINNLQKQKQVYSQLRGITDSTCQVYSNQGEIQVMFFWLRARDKLGLPRLEAYEATRDYDRRITEGLKEIPSNNQKLMEIIGLIEVSFPPSDELDALIRPIDVLNEKYESIRVKVKEGFNNAHIESLSEDALRQDAFKWFYEMIEDSFRKPLSQLADYLKREIATEENMLKKPLWKMDGLIRAIKHWWWPFDS